MDHGNTPIRDSEIWVSIAQYAARGLFLLQRFAIVLKTRLIRELVSDGRITDGH